MGGNLSCQLMMRFHVESEVGFLAVRCGENEFQQTINAFIDAAFWQLALLNGDEHNRVEVRGAAGHFQIQTGLKSLHAFVHGAPVGHEHLVKAPFLTQNLAQQERIITAVDPVDAVVGAHQGRRACIFDGIFESWQIDFAQGALVKQAIRLHARVFLTVGSKVLQRDAYSIALYPFDPVFCQLTGQIRIF